VNKLSIALVSLLSLTLMPHLAGAQQPAAPPTGTVLAAQQNVPPAGQQAAADVERAAKRFRVGVQGGVGLDPEILDVGAHAAFGPIFHPNLEFRPGVEIGVGELTTLFGINLDVLYTVPGFTRDTRWLPYIGVGPNFSLSHRGFETEEGDHVSTTSAGTTGATVDLDDRNRFDFSDTDFNGGMNFIVGMRKQSGMFFEMKATAWGVSNIRLLAGFNF
jgi:hypothetical protein